MYALVDCMPCGNFPFVVVKINHDKRVSGENYNSMSMLGLDREDELDYLGIMDVRDLVVGQTYCYEDEDERFDIIRII